MKVDTHGYMGRVKYVSEQNAQHTKQKDDRSWTRDRMVAGARTKSMYSTILFNSTVTFNRSWCVNTNDIVKHFNAILSVS